MSASESSQDTSVSEEQPQQEEQAAQFRRQAEEDARQMIQTMETFYQIMCKRRDSHE